MKASSFLIRISGIVMVLVSITAILTGADTIKTHGSGLSKKAVEGKKITVATPTIRKQIATPVIRKPEAPLLYKFTRGGPVISTDPYFTAHIGEHRVFRDALDSTLAYYEPVISIGSRIGNALGEGLPDPLASRLYGVLFVYHNFDNPNPVKWGQIKIVVSAKRPDNVSLEAVQSLWKNVVKLRPIPIVPDPKGPELSIRYPSTVNVRLSKTVENNASEDGMQWVFQSSDQPTPQNLSARDDNDMLNESETRSLLQVVSQVEIPGFEAQLKLRLSYPAWKVVSPIPLRKPIVIRHAMLSLPKRSGSIPAPTPPPETMHTTRLKTVKPLNFQTNTIRTVSVLKPLRPIWIGEQKPKAGLEYAFQEDLQLRFAVPLSITASSTPDYDYYFLSGSGRWGGPHLDFDPNAPIPQRPVEVTHMEAWEGYWFETHFQGERTVWVAPRRFGLRWTSDAGMKPSLHFSIQNQPNAKIRSVLVYDLYPEPSESDLGTIAKRLSDETGESIRYLPLTDLMDFGNLKLTTIDPLLEDLLESSQITLRSLNPDGLSEPWIRLEVDAEWNNWADFTLFMRKANLGEWEIGFRGALPHDRRSFSLSGNLLRCQGAPLFLSEAKVMEDRKVSLQYMNFGFIPYRIKGLKLSHSTMDSDGVPYLLALHANPIVVSPGYGVNPTDGEASIPEPLVVELPKDAPPLDDPIQAEVLPEWIEEDAESTLSLDEDVSFSYLRSLCYRYVGDSEIIDIPVAANEDANWLSIDEVRIVARFQGYVYALKLSPGQDNMLRVRRIPREGVFADASGAAEADTIEYRIMGTLKDGKPFTHPALPDQWLNGSIHGFLLDLPPPAPSSPE
ncbi:MAG: hypothetical protein JW706_01530 [Opitutales bacterium]|nr:hypothetical protein [Opitutales bacterium]